MLVLKYIHIYIKSLIHFVLRRETKFAYSFLTISTNNTFRISEAQKKDKLLIFRYLFHSFKLILRKIQVISKTNTDITLININSSVQEINENYIRLNLKNINTAVINRNQLGCSCSWIEKAFLFLFLLVQFVVIGVFNICLPKYRAERSLMLLETVEHICILKIILVNKFKTAYFTGCSAEKDTNLLSIVLSDYGIKTYLIPSANPIKYYYKYAVSHGFIFTSAFQMDEFESLKKNWFVNEFFLWPCLNFEKMSSFYLNRNLIENDNVIGFLSSGVWKRKERGDKDPVNEFKAEEILMTLLKNFAGKFNYTIQIYLHPGERRTSEDYKKAIEIYSKIFEGITIAFLDQTATNWKEFEKSNVAISVYSSSNIERLYCGFKTFYVPIGLEYNPFSDTGLQNIVIDSEIEFEKKLLHALKLSNKGFFEENKLTNYSYNELMSQQQHINYKLNPKC